MTKAKQQAYVRNGVTRWRAAPDRRFSLIKEHLRQLWPTAPRGFWGRPNHYAWGETFLWLPSSSYDLSRTIRPTRKQGPGLFAAIEAWEARVAWRKYEAYFDD